MYYNFCRIDKSLPVTPAMEVWPHEPIMDSEKTNDVKAGIRLCPQCERRMTEAANAMRRHGSKMVADIQLAKTDLSAAGDRSQSSGIVLMKRNAPGMLTVGTSLSTDCYISAVELDQPILTVSRDVDITVIVVTQTSLRGPAAAANPGG